MHATITSLLDRLQRGSSLYLRLALATAFLSAVADRFGLWGSFGTPGVAWGEFGRFVTYVGTLNWFAPAPLVPTLAWVATVGELALGLLLLLGLWTRLAGLLSSLLLLTFAVTMTLALGPEPPLSFSVWTASAAGLALASLPDGAHTWSLDQWLQRPRPAAARTPALGAI